jgi:hypothetical protein
VAVSSCTRPTCMPDTCISRNNRMPVRTAPTVHYSREFHNTAVWNNTGREKVGMRERQRAFLFSRTVMSVTMHHQKERGMSGNGDGMGLSEASMYTSSGRT